MTGGALLVVDFVGERYANGLLERSTPSGDLMKDVNLWKNIFEKDLTFQHRVIH
jgi:hypothetical protein